MDRYGRIPVLAGGCLAGIGGCLTTALGCAVDSAVLVIAGFALVGIAQGTILLSRAAAADMYPPARRARGISYVLFGALFGAALGPLVFRPLFAGQGARPGRARAAVDRRRRDHGRSASCSSSASGPDPRTIAQKLHFDAGGTDEEAAPLREIVRRPGVLTALVAAIASFAVHGLGDEPDRLPRDRPRPPPVRRLHRDQPPHRRHVRARARDRPDRRRGRAASGRGRGPAADGRSRRSASPGSRAFSGSPSRSSCSASAGTSPTSPR